VIEESQNGDLQLTQEIDSWEAASDEDWLNLERKMAEAELILSRQQFTLLGLRTNMFLHPFNDIAHTGNLSLRQWLRSFVNQLSISWTNTGA
jgi:hypothetical protein